MGVSIFFLYFEAGAKINNIANEQGENAFFLTPICALCSL